MAQKAHVRKGRINYEALLVAIFVLAYCGIVWYGIIEGLKALVRMMSDFPY